MKHTIRKSLTSLLATVMLSSMPAFTDAAVITVTTGTGTNHTGANDLVKTGTGVYTLTGTGNTYTGTTTIDGGTLRVGAMNGLIKTSQITVNSGGVLDLAANNALAYTYNTPYIILNGGSIISTVDGNHVNLGNLTSNGGDISSTVKPSNLGNFLLGGEIHVTQDTLIDCPMILIRTNANGINGKAGNFIVDPGKTLTINAEINFSDLNGRDSWDISGGGTIKMLKATSSTLNDEKINISGEGTTLDLCAHNPLGVDGTSLSTITLADGGRLNYSMAGSHANLGYVVFDGGSLEAVDANGARVQPSQYGNYIACGKWTVLSDSSINATVIFRGTRDAGQVEVAPDATLVWGGTVNFKSDFYPDTDLKISGGGTVIVPSGATMTNATRYKNELYLSGEGTKLVYGDGGDSGSWNCAMTLNPGTIFETNRSKMGSYAFNVYGYGGTISNVGTAEPNFSWVIETHAAENGEYEAGLTFTGTKPMSVTAEKLEGDGNVIVTGESAQLKLLGNNPKFTSDFIVRDGGTVNVVTADAFGTGTLVFDGGTLTNTGAQPSGWSIMNSGQQDFHLNAPVEVRSTGTVNPTGRTIVFANSLTGTGTLTKIGGNQLQFAGDNTAFAGKITSTSGWMVFHGAQSTSALARYGSESNGICFAPSVDDPTHVFKIGMLENSNKGSEFRVGSASTGQKIANAYLEIGGSDMSGTFAGKLLDYGSNGVNAVVHTEKVGTGTWTITGEHSTSGVYTVSGGKLQIGDGTATGNLGDKVRTVGHIKGFTYTDTDTIPTLMGGFVLNEGGTLSFNRNDSGQLRVNQPIVANGGTLMQEGSKNIHMQGKISGSELVIDAAETGTGTIYFERGAKQGTVTEITADAVDLEKLTVNGARIVTKIDFNEVEINGGTFIVGNDVAPTTITGTVTLNEGGTLAPGDSKTNKSVVENLILNGGKIGSVNGSAILNVNHAEAVAGTTTTVSMNNGARVFVNEAITGSGTIVLDGQGSMTRQLQIHGDGTNFEGTYVSKNGGFIGMDAAQAASAKAKYVSEGNGNFYFAAVADDKTEADGTVVFNIGELSTAEGSKGEARTGSNSKHPVTMRVGGLNTDSTYAGSIKEYKDSDAFRVSVAKTGTGMWTLAGQNSYKGTTTVEQGVLNITGTITSDTTVQDGAYITGIGTIEGKLFYEEGSAHLIDLTNTQLRQQVLSDEALKVNGEVAHAGEALTLKLIVDQASFEELDSLMMFDIIEAEGLEDIDIFLDLTEAIGDWAYEYDEETNILSLTGNLVSAVPEPSTLALLVTALGLFGLRSVRRRKTAK
ncbi:MAG: autotransporter-associated beta strand repeat-containing protein [Thermoguttaceae bacterium]|nr:autotransporter-associated beta strand repeat-containing protein [Thermoguttaceae bacterium]